MSSDAQRGLRVASLLLLAGCSHAAQDAQTPRVTFVERAAPKAPILCKLNGAPGLVRSDVFGPGGLTAKEQAGVFEASFPLKEDQRIAVDLKTPTSWHPTEPETLPDDSDLKLLDAMVQRDEQIAHAPAYAKSGSYALAGWESVSNGGPIVFLAFVAYDTPRRLGGMTIGAQPLVVTTTFMAPAGGLAGAPNAPSLAPLGDGFFLLIWSQGDDKVQQLRAEPIDGAGIAVGPAIELTPPDANIVGQSAAAIGPGGDGYVAYVVSRLASYDVVAAPVLCTR
jgi:hypothetical protein